MEPSFWSWEKARSARGSISNTDGRNGAQLLELGKALPGQRPHGHRPAVAMEPSFWSWEKHHGRISTVYKVFCRNGAQLLELGKAAWDFMTAPLRMLSQWSPAFGAGKRMLSPMWSYRLSPVAMEPSFWSWEKLTLNVRWGVISSRNGAQLLELGKGKAQEAYTTAQERVAMEPSFWSWEKDEADPEDADVAQTSQWSPAFGAGKSGPSGVRSESGTPSQWSPAFGAGKSWWGNELQWAGPDCRNGAQLLELGKV